jgi:hypothetical protein
MRWWNSVTGDESVMAEVEVVEDDGEASRETLLLELERIDLLR